MKKACVFTVLYCLCVLVVFCFFVNLGGFVVFANVNDSFTSEDYTDSDFLLLSDGTLSGRNIYDFSNDVKALSNLSYIEDLNQVVPAEYLDWEGEDCVFQHYGKEYGFYMVKEGICFDLLLIDFVYEFENDENETNPEHNNEYKIMQTI